LGAGILRELDKKNILIILPFYFGYQKVIKTFLLNSGANIWMIDEDVNEFSFFYRSISVYFPTLYYKIVRNYYHKRFMALPSHIDYVLVIKGSTLTINEMDYLKSKYKYAKFIMYQWDSVSNYPYAVNVSSWCDFCLTFDPIDAKKYNWKYRPLFFDMQVCHKVETRDIDIAYICSLHSERVKLYKALLKMANREHFIFFDYLYSNRWTFYRQKYLKKNKLFDISSKSVKFKPLSMERVAAIYDRTKVIVDFKFTNQHGLTMRTIESIGHKCKLITNNELIAKEDFYNSANIYIYNDVNNLEIPSDFLNSEYREIPSEIYNKYTIEGWCKDIFTLTDY